MKRIYHPIINLLTITLVIYIAVDTFYRIVKVGMGQGFNSDIAMLEDPDVKSVSRVPVDDLQIIMDRNIFGTTEKIPPETVNKEVETLEPTKLKISLKGTVTGDKHNAVAIIEDIGKRTQGLYRVGDNVMNAVVKAILRGKVVLSVGGQDEVLVMPEPSSSGPLLSETSVRTNNALVPRDVERSITVRKQDLEESFENIDNLMAQVRVTPRLKGGNLEGLTVTGIKANSILRKMGLRNGDIILAVGGHPVSAPDEILGMYNDIRSGSDVSLLIERRGQQRSLNYNIR